MKTVRDACQLQDNALSIKLGDQIEQLDELINAEGNGPHSREDIHTQGCKTSSARALHALPGVSSQAVFHLKQAMVAARRTYSSALGYSPSTCASPKVLRRHGRLSAFVSAEIAAFNGRNNPDHFFWVRSPVSLEKEISQSVLDRRAKAPDKRLAEPAGR